MTSFTTRKTALSTSQARFTLSSRVQTGAAALLLSVSALAMSSGTAQAQCAPLIGSPLPDVIVCGGIISVGTDGFGGNDVILLGESLAPSIGVYAGGADDDLITLDNILGVIPTIYDGLIDGGSGNDTINLLNTGGAGASINDVLGGTGADIITLNGAVVNGIIQGNDGNDTIDLLPGGTVVQVQGNDGADTITLNGATVAGPGASIFGQSGNDTIILTLGSSPFVQGNDGNDTITLNGATVSSSILGQGGSDTINLNSGIVGDVQGDGVDNALGQIEAGAADTITLNGATVTGGIFGQEGGDTILLDAGSVGGDVDGGIGDDFIDLDFFGAGVTVGGDILGQSGNDTIHVHTGGTVTNVDGGSGADTIWLDGGTVTGDIFGGADNDDIDLNGGTANNVFGDAGDDTITLDGATVVTIFGGIGNDTIDLLLGGTATGFTTGVDGEAGADTITLNGATINWDIHGGADNDTINLLAGTADWVHGDAGADTITLAGATVFNIFGGTENDTINLDGGTANGSVNGDAGDDTITLNSAAVGIDIDGGLGVDYINLLDGTVGGNVDGGADNDHIDLDGAGVVVTGDINGEAGDDIIHMFAGMVTNVNGGVDADLIQLLGATVTGTIDGGTENDDIDLFSGLAGNVLGGAGLDNIELNGAVIGGNVAGGLDSDIILLQSGAVGGSVAGNEGNDAITLSGTVVVIGDLQGNADDDTFLLTSGTFGGNLDGGIGSDTATIAPTFSLASIGVASLLDGGDDVSVADGWVDLLTIQASGALIGDNVVNWEHIDVDNASLTLLGTGLTTSSDLGLGLHAINVSTIDLDDDFDVTGNVSIFGGSTLVAEDGGGIYSISGELVMDGTLDMSDGFGPNDVLTVQGAYDTFGADLLMDAALDATEAGDLLVLNGPIVNNGGFQTFLTITDTNPGGPGSFTGTGPGNGIPLVDNSGFGNIIATDFVFDPVTHPTNEILKVPFVYTLSLENDDILYLQSDVLPQIYGYAILSEMMREEFPILRDRLGDGRYNGYESAPNPTVGLDNAGVWARIDGSKRSIEHDGDFTTGEWDASRGEIELGIDIPMDAFGGVGVFGVSAHAVRGTADANSGITPNPDVAQVTTTGFGGGLSFAWFPGGGFYTDVQGRLTAWDGDVELDSRDIDQDIDGIGWGASLEVGNRFQVATNTAVIPRGQVVYTDVSFDSFSDDDGVEVDQDDSASVVISGGLTVEQMFADNGIAIFADASVNYDLLDDSSIDASGVTFESGLEDTWGAVAVGATMGVADGASAYIAADLSSPLTSNFGDSYGYGFRAGFRIDF